MPCTCIYGSAGVHQGRASLHKPSRPVQLPGEFFPHQRGIYMSQIIGYSVFGGCGHVMDRVNLSCDGMQVSVVSTVIATLFLRTTLHATSVSDGQTYLGLIFFAIIHMVRSYAEPDGPTEPHVTHLHEDCPKMVCWAACRSILSAQSLGRYSVGFHFPCMCVADVQRLQRDVHHGWQPGRCTCF